jgi:hypothetical protein
LFFDQPSGQYSFAQTGNVPNGNVNRTVFNAAGDCLRSDCRHPAIARVATTTQAAIGVDVERRRIDGVAVVVITGYLRVRTATTSLPTSLWVGNGRERSI